MFVNARRLTDVALLVALLFAAAEAKRWAPQELTSPHGKTSSACLRGYGKHSSVCDPSRYISREQRQALDRALKAAGRRHGYANYDEGARCANGYKIGAAIVEYMAPDGYSSAAQVAETMAKTLLMQWRMGDCGILMFASVGDRRMYIAVGSDAQQRLTTEKVAGVVSDMVPYMANGNPAGAFLTGAHDIESILYPSNRYGAPPPGASNHGKPREPKVEGIEWFGWELHLVSFAAIFALIIACCNGKGGPERAAVKKMLRKDHCALCLDPFECSFSVASAEGQPSPEDGAPESGEGGAQVGAGDDAEAGAPSVPASTRADDEIVLVCGHRFHRRPTCYDDSMTECPLCKYAEGATTLVESENAERNFRLNKIRTKYPELADAVLAEAKRGGSPSRRRRRNVENDDGYRHSGGGGPGMWGLLGAGAAGATLASLFSGGESHQQSYGSANQAFLGDSSANQIGGGGGGWGAPSFSVGGGGGGWGSNLLSGGGGDGGGGFGSAFSGLGGGGGGWGGSSGGGGGW